MAGTMTMRMDPKTIQQLDDLAKKTRRSRSFIAKEAIELYLNSDIADIHMDEERQRATAATLKLEKIYKAAKK